ncbi:MAG: DMT family transporter [Pseudomonadota bacterium]
MPVFVFTAITMVAFALNSVFARLALLDGAIDEASYTSVRIIAGAVALALLIIVSRKQTLRTVIKGGNWISAAALFAYAVTLSFAYVGVETGLGALILFACVQATMIGWALYKGDRPIAPEWFGLIVAFGAFAWLVSPGLEAPDPFSAFLMGLSGVAWGIYSLRGRSTSDPLLATAGNFVLAVPMSLAVSLLFFSQINMTAFGLALAVASGALTSGLGYALWYRVLPQIGATQGAIVQLTVPVIAGFGGLLFAAEPFTARFIIASILILGGVGIAIIAKTKRI